MFKIAKNINTFNEQVNARIVNVEVHNIDHQNNRLINQTLQELEINISGTIDDDACSMHFIISKPIKDYYDIKEYQKVEIEIDHIFDSYIMINEVVYADPLIELEILRFNDEFVFSMFFRDYDNEFFGNAEFNIKLKELEQKEESKVVNQYRERINE